MKLELTLTPNGRHEDLDIDGMRIYELYPYRFKNETVLCSDESMITANKTHLENPDRKVGMKGQSSGESFDVREPCKG